MTFPGLSAEKRAVFEEQRQAIHSALTPETLTALTDEASSAGDGETEAFRQELAAINNAEKGAELRNSIAGRFGTALESISLLAGFDWRTNIALAGGFAAKEVIVSTLGTAYSMGEVDAEEAESLSQRLQNDPGWNRVVAVSALVFIMFYAPCFVTVVCIAKESSWRWATFSMTFNTVFAFAMSVAVYQAGMFFNLG
jgi:ferrous iron transport protein B